jgi:hypothetical protein
MINKRAAKRRVRGDHSRGYRFFLPLTPTLSPQAGRGELQEAHPC